MKSFLICLVILASAVAAPMVLAQPVSDCLPCHEHYGSMMWPTNPHSHTQDHVAQELAANWAGQRPDSVISGTAAEDCIACHAPRAVTIAGGMSETQAMGYFFSTTNGCYTDSTRSAHSDSWPNVTCVSCHQMPPLHPENMPTLAIYNSVTAQYESVTGVSALCGQCHGGLRFAETDHQLYAGWKESTHGHRGQQDVAGELAGSWAGSTPADVTTGPDAENCIACHAPTTTKLAGGITEAEVLGRFFTTTGGTFTANTAPADTTNWPDVACNTCHDPHQPDSIAVFNSTTRAYQYFASRNEQCGQCHGNLKFPGTDHLSYNVESGTGGIGVPDGHMMPGVQCVDCHMHRNDADGMNSTVYEGHRWSVFIHEPNGSVTSACTACHTDMTAAAAQTTVDNWRTEYDQTRTNAEALVAAADSAVQGSTDSTRIRNAAEADRNLALAQGDESGGAHNHTYVMALLDDAIAKSNQVLGVGDQPVQTPLQFALLQNYPNPFNPSTQIEFQLAATGPVELYIYNTLGQRVATLLRGTRPAGNYSVQWNGKDSRGLEAAAGVYFYQLRAGSLTATRKMLLIR
jgi:hypothetical protein